MFTISLILFVNPAWSEDPPGAGKQESPHKRWSLRKLSEQDVILPVSSIEWGSPDRWSFTSRYIHMFEKDRDGKTWLNNATIALSPGWTGGRLSMGYQGIYSSAVHRDFGVISELRFVLLKTWGKPLDASPDSLFYGIEFRVSVTFFNLGLGFYTDTATDTDDNRESFYGFHIGLGI